jgi:hypothetical protein
MTNHENQEILLQQGPYYKTPYFGRHGWVSVKSLGDLLKEAYLRAAPKRLVKQLLEAEKAMTGHYE